MYLVSAAQMRELDRLTIEQYGTPGHILMERAGAGATQAFVDFFRNALPKRVLVVAGKGNNGGDGFVIARLLKRQGLACEVVLAAKKDDVRGDARRNLRAFLRLRGRVTEVTSHDQLAAVQKSLTRCDAIIDALLGTGLNAPVQGKGKGLYAALIELMNACGVPIAAVDVPSGLNADSGQTLGATVQADLTVTFGYPKFGQVFYPGTTAVGQLALVDIGIAAQAIKDVLAVSPQTALLTRREMGARIRDRRSEAHKGDYGHLLVLAGARGKSGAALLCASSALRTGTGLVTLAGPKGLVPIFSSVLLEAMTTPLPETAGGSLKLNRKALLQALQGKSAVAFGPGIGVSAQTKRMTRWLLKNSTVPILVDADGLNCIAADVSMLKTTKVPLILTPHPGEMSRLTKTQTTDIQAHRLDIARGFAVQHSCYLILKGARTVIAAPDGRAWLNPTGNPGMASGGMGDVLAGLIGGLLAQGYSPEEACCLGVFLHGAAADAVAEEKGEVGMLARDVIERLPGTLRAVRQAGQLDPYAADYSDILS